MQCQWSVDVIKSFYPLTVFEVQAISPTLYNEFLLTHMQASEVVLRLSPQPELRQHDPVQSLLQLVSPTVCRNDEWLHSTWKSPVVWAMLPIKESSHWGSLRRRQRGNSDCLFQNSRPWITGDWRWGHRSVFCARLVQCVTGPTVDWSVPFGSELFGACKSRKLSSDGATQIMSAKMRTR